MKTRFRLLPLFALAAGAASGQEVSVYGSTLAQLWKSETPGFDKATYAPATQFLGIDALNLGTERLSLHLFGWGMADLADQSRYNGANGSKTQGDLSFGYLQYRFPTANAELKAGRFSVNQAVGIEQVDGLSARADLRGGFTVSAFAGQPVLYKNPLQTGHEKNDYAFQRNWIAGARIGLRVPKVGEFGLSYLQDGQNAAKDLPRPSETDYTRRQVGLDLRISPVAAFDLSGRTVFDVAKHPETPAGETKPSNIAEHDYQVSVRPTDLFALTGTVTERNYRAFYAGTNLHSLFNQHEKGKFSAYGAGLVFGTAAKLQVTADFRHTKREIYGEANRFGVDAKWAVAGTKIVAGAGIHQVSAPDAAASPDPESLRYGTSHSEARLWAMWETGKLSFSGDGIYYKFKDSTNPNLYGKDAMFELVVSAGYQATPEFKVAGDLAYGANAFAKSETRGLLRLEYRFGGPAAKGGKK
ncbi:MAG: hypothetical protein HY823_12195 [Acidobacteria bacterium]|nr:hypothetical protein [Acidobacteriota bacterium]